MVHDCNGAACTHKHTHTQIPDQMCVSLETSIVYIPTPLARCPCCTTHALCVSQKLKSWAVDLFWERQFDSFSLSLPLPPLPPNFWRIAGVHNGLVLDKTEEEIIMKLKHTNREKIVKLTPPRAQQATTQNDGKSHLLWTSLWGVPVKSCQMELQKENDKLKLTYTGDLLVLKKWLFGCCWDSIREYYLD